MSSESRSADAVPTANSVMAESAAAAAVSQASASSTDADTSKQNPSGLTIIDSSKPVPVTSIAALTEPNTASASNPVKPLPNPTPNPKKRKASTGTEKKDRLASLAPGGEDYTDLDEDGQSTTSGPGRGNKDHKRTRVHFSCVECHRRKQKCDRKEPCSQCLARRVPHLCKPFLNGIEDPSANDVQARLSSIETLLARLVSSLPTGLYRTAESHAHLPGTSTPTNDLDHLLVSQQGEDVFHPASDPSAVPDLSASTAQASQGASGSGAAGPSQAIVTHRPAPSGLFPAGASINGQTLPLGTPNNRGSGYGWGLREGRLINLIPEENGDLLEVLATLKESGISKNHLEWLIAGVPGRRMADGLVELYFRDIDWTRYKIDKISFMRKYETFFDSIGRNPANPKVDGDTLRWLPLLFIVLAIATLSAPHEVVPSSDQPAWSRRFYGSARSSLEYAKALQRDNLDVLFAGLLASRYMLLTRRPAEGSTPLTTAFQLGLYRDGTVLNMQDKKEVEIRRRAWAMLYHLDRTVSLLVGRPASISDAHTDTKPPANLDDEELEGDFKVEGHPMDRPTVYTYIVVRHKLAEIMGRIAYHTFAIQLPDYQRVLELDKELLAWRDSLPAFFNMKSPDLQHDKSHPYLFVQRHLLACEWYYTRITLNRPYLLRRKPQDSRYAYSKDAAIESATADLLSRRAFVMEKGNLIVNSGGYRVLNSYMVLGVTIKLDPESAQADKLRHLLNVVSGRAPDSQGRISEPLVKEELAIVEFLTAKTSSSNAPPATSSKNVSKSASSGQKTKEETPVDLLLGLAKTRSGKRAAEEEQRQLRLQTFREQEERRLGSQKAGSSSGSGSAFGGGGGNGANQQGQSSSPWGYQPPSMPGLDVQQPFDNAGMRRQPRPLQPPAPRRRDDPMFGSSSQSVPGQSHMQSLSGATTGESNAHAAGSAVAQAHRQQSQSQQTQTQNLTGGFGSVSPSTQHLQQPSVGRNRTFSGQSLGQTSGSALAWPESFDGIDLNIRPSSAQSLHNPHSSSQSHLQDMSYNPNHYPAGSGGMHPPLMSVGGAYSHAHQHQHHPGSASTHANSPGGNQNQYPSPMGSGSVNGSISSQAQGPGGNETLFMQNNACNMSPFNPMSSLPNSAGHGSGQGQGQGQGGGSGQGGSEFGGLEAFIQNMQNGNMGNQTNGQGQFGNPMPELDGFDFSNLMGNGVEAGNLVNQGGFNPFALQQTEEGAPGGEMNGDEETTFLNYILTKFANSQPEGQ